MCIPQMKAHKVLMPQWYMYWHAVSVKQYMVLRTLRMHLFAHTHCLSVHLLINIHMQDNHYNARQ